LVEAFVEQYSQEMRKEVEGFAPEALEILAGLSFPGNVRELRNLVERAVILCKGGRIMPGDLTMEQESYTRTRASVFGDLNLGVMEKDLIAEALRRTSGNQVRAAELLGISRDALRRRLHLHGLKARQPQVETSVQ